MSSGTSSGTPSEQQSAPAAEPVSPLYDTRPPELSRWRRIQIPLIAAAATTIIRVLGPTLRFESLGLQHYEQSRARGEPVIFTFWHRCIISATWYWRKRGIVVMNTTNFDGQWTRRVIEHLGFGTAQGSSTRGGLRGLAVMARRLQEGRDAAFTIDGPRGPRYVAKPGPVMLARKTGRPIYVFHIGVEKARTLEKSWDLMQVPKPFSRAVMVSAPLIFVPPKATADELERKQAEMQAALERVRDVAESWFGLTEAERAVLRKEWNTGAKTGCRKRPLAEATMSEIKEHAERIIRTLREQGYQAYLVGGCVRDLLLGREPADYDVATDATPDEVMRIFPETYAVGAQFGVVLVPGSAPSSVPTSDLNHTASTKAGYVEVATFRSDIGYSDGRHPDQVRFSNSPREDVERRDFTINGLLLDPMTNQVLDFVGGQDDLQARVIRTIGQPELRFAEDKLRMLRAVRFAARFGYAIASETFAAIRKLAAGIHQVSRERVRDELTKMLTEGHARDALLLLDETGLLREVLPEISAMKGVRQPPQFHPEGDVFVHTLLLLQNLPHPCPPALAWGALLHDVGKPATFRFAPDRIRFDGHVAVGVKMAEEICRRLRFSNHDTEQILALVENHMRFAHAPQMKESTFKKFVRLPRFEEHLELHRLDCLGSHGDLTSYQFTRQRIASIPPESIRPVPLVSGDDLIAAGYEPGPRFKEILSVVEDAQLEGRLPSKESAMQYVRQKFPRSAGESCPS